MVNNCVENFELKILNEFKLNKWENNHKENSKFRNSKFWALAKTKAKIYKTRALGGWMDGWVGGWVVKPG